MRRKPPGLTLEPQLITADANSMWSMVADEEMAAPCLHWTWSILVDLARAVIEKQVLMGPNTWKGVWDMCGSVTMTSVTSSSFDM